MNVSGWSSTPAREPQGGPNVHHGLSLMFCIRPGFTDETIPVLHVFGKDTLKKIVIGTPSIPYCAQVLIVFLIVPI
jgi:hypothetical protein